MEGETRRGGEASAEGAAMGFILTVGVMEDLAEKLKLLDYETGFCKSQGLRPLSRLVVVSTCLFRGHVQLDRRVDCHDE